MNMLKKMSIKDVDVNGKKCLVRVDFNVPMKDGKITDEGIRKATEWIMDNYLNLNDLKDILTEYSTTHDEDVGFSESDDDFGMSPMSSGPSISGPEFNDFEEPDLGVEEPNITPEA